MARIHTATKTARSTRLLAVLLLALLVALVGTTVWSAHETLAYAKDIGAKNKQACDACNKVKSGTEPDGYTDVLGNKAVFRGGTAESGLQGATRLDTDPNTFAAPLPYGDTYVDTTRLKWGGRV